MFHRQFFLLLLKEPPTLFPNTEQNSDYLTNIGSFLLVYANYGILVFYLARVSYCHLYLWGRGGGERCRKIGDVQYPPPPLVSDQSLIVLEAFGGRGWKSRSSATQKRSDLFLLLFIGYFSWYPVVMRVINTHLSLSREDLRDEKMVKFCYVFNISLRCIILFVGYIKCSFNFIFQYKKYNSIISMWL